MAGNHSCVVASTTSLAREKSKLASFIAELGLQMSTGSAHLRLNVHGSRLRRFGRCNLGHRVDVLDVQVGKLVPYFRMFS